ncbi:MAG: cob(I)yrinic acid a,c-diamide adenosyltransferase [Bacteroidales bacterium]|jgi:cob(I)alamin adenosyltransferase|nr:cob(I)yrinic acid a,c-diamide adenosyltransferase [Bacteroidales bacterium]
MSIYTKTGDKGLTSLVNGTRVPKNHIRVEAYGTIDELNAHIALLETIIENETVKGDLLEIENNLFVVQTHLAIDPDKDCFFKIPDIQKVNADDLEKKIDRMNEQLTTARTFILLGGHVIIAQCHIARCICRRAERTLITLSNTSVVNSQILCYVNRLSDYLFILARYMAKILEVKEQTASL